jgi:hypothetical protein
MNGFASLLSVLLFLAPAGADPAEAAARKAVEEFRKAFVNDDPAARERAVAALVDFPHEITAKEIAARAFADPEPSVRSVAAQVLGRMEGLAEVAGPLLRDRIAKEGACPDVLYSIVRGIAKLGYTGARKELILAGSHFKDDAYISVTTEVIRTFGLQKDVKALPWLLSLAEYGEGEVVRGRRGPAMKVPFGQDPSVSRWNWMRKYGKHAIPKEGSAPDTLDKWWILDLLDAVKAITGVEFEDAAAFRKWLTEHLKELGLTKADLPAKR